MTIHVIGMGILGSLLAWHLQEHGMDFTWEDADMPYCAWRATTGLIYPSGHQEDMEAYAVWQQWHHGKHPWKLQGLTEEGAYWFLSKNVPHQGKGTICNTIGPLHRGSQNTFHLHGQRLVEETRAYFSAQRRMQTPDDASKIIEAHGYTQRMHHVIWGWSSKVTLAIHHSLLSASSPLRPMLYLRIGRYELGYANPIPGEEHYYGGTALITQKHAHMLEMKDKVDKWARYVERHTQGLVRIASREPAIQGWRPVATPSDTSWITCTHTSIQVRPLWSSGIRHAPHVMHAVMNELEK